MRFVLAAMLVVLVSCRNDQPVPASAPQTRSIDSLVAARPGSFHDAGGSSALFLPDSEVTYIRNVTYEEQFLNRGSELEYFLVKQTRDTRRMRAAEGVDSWISVEIFDLTARSLIHRMNTRADEVKFATRYLQTVKYGCCGAENSCLLMDIWNDHVFLPYNEKYYIVEVMNGGTRLFLGYLSDAYDDSAMIHGELILAHEIAHFGSDGKFAGYEYRTANRVIFKAKDRELFKDLIGFSPSITLLRNTSRDEIVDHPDYQELRLWSFDHHRELQGIDFTVLRLVFQNGKAIVVDVPLKDGLLYGDAAETRTVILEE